MILKRSEVNVNRNIGLWILAIALCAVSFYAMAQAEAPEVAPSETPIEEPTAAEATVAEETQPVATAEATPESGTFTDLPVGPDETPGLNVKVGQNNRISLSVDNVPLADVLRMFTTISGANIVASSNLETLVTVSMQDVEWQPALQAILESVDMALVEKTHGIFNVVARSAIASALLETESIRLNHVTVSNVLPAVRGMLVSSNAAVVAFPADNAVIITETPARIAKIREVLARIDKPRPQVLIEAKFIELNDRAIKDLGINWQVLQNYSVTLSQPRFEFSETRRENAQDARANWSTDSRSRSQGRADSTSTKDGDDFTTSRRSSAGDASGSTALWGKNFTDFDAENNKITTIIPYERLEVLTAILGADDFKLTLSALKQQSGVTIVSNPKIIVASGETASIHVGTQQPNVRAVPQAGGQTVTYSYELDQNRPFIDIGVKVDVTPTVNTASNISIRITPMLTRKLPRSEGQEPQPGLFFPALSITTVDTEFALESGRTVAIGGLTRTDDTEDVTKIPVLGDIPVIGKLFFRHTHKDKGQTEVIIFVTVDLAQAEKVTESTGLPSESLLIQQHLLKRQMEQQEAAEKAQKLQEAKKPIKR